jgi:hypothetical protein
MKAYTISVLWITELLLVLNDVEGFSSIMNNAALSATQKLVADDLIHRADLICLPLTELSVRVGGSGRAKMIWESLRKGDHPLLLPEGEGLSEKARGLVLSELAGSPLIATDVTIETLSDCGTRKFLQTLSDGQSVESVLIPAYKYDRTTLCVSTQIGCDRGCAFCLTGTMGLLRNLTGPEIISQVGTYLKLSRAMDPEILIRVRAIGNCKKSYFTQLFL